MFSTVKILAIIIVKNDLTLFNSFYNLDKNFLLAIHSTQSRNQKEFNHETLWAQRKTYKRKMFLQGNTIFTITFFIIRATHGTNCSKIWRYFCC